MRLGSEDTNLKGGPGTCSPGKTLEIWITLDYISRVFMVEKENAE